MNEIKKILINKNEIDKKVKELAKKISCEFDEAVFVIILKGSVIFASDLMREATIPLTIDFMQASSYGSGTKSSGEVSLAKDLEHDISEKNVIIVEDIIDSGNTLLKLKNLLLKRNPKSLKICTLLSKPARREAPIEADYIGFEIPDEFVVGYGMDYNEFYRNLPYIGILDPAVYSKEDNVKNHVN